MWMGYNNYLVLIKFMCVTLNWILWVWCIVLKRDWFKYSLCTKTSAAVLICAFLHWRHSLAFPLSSTHCKLAATSHGRSCYIASKRLLRLLCLGEDELKLQRRPEGSSKMAFFDRVLFLLQSTANVPAGALWSIIVGVCVCTCGEICLEKERIFILCLIFMPVIITCSCWWEGSALSLLLVWFHSVTVFFQ